MYQNRVCQSVHREQLNTSCDYNQAHFPLNTKCDLLVIYQEVDAHGEESKKVSIPSSTLRYETFLNRVVLRLAKQIVQF